MMMVVIGLGLLCAGVVLYEGVNRPGDPLAVMRAPVAGAWAVTLLAYGVNRAGYPDASGTTVVALAITCVGALLMTAPWVTLDTVRDAGPAGEMPRWLRLALFLVIALLVAWDLYFIVARVTEGGWTAGLSQYRVDRGAKTGAYALPGLEVVHAVAAAGGALGFADWIANGRRLGLVTVMLALMTALFSSGRWDVVAYVVWLLSIYAFLATRQRHKMLVRQAVVYAGLAVFFAAHGELLGKIEGATALANSSVEERAEQAEAALPTVLTGALESDRVAAAPSPTAPSPATPSAAPSVTAEPLPTPSCARWEEGLATANAGFRALSRVERVFVLYLSGPAAALDRVLCEGRAAERIVLMYWPRKVMRILGLRPPELLLVVDPYAEIGIPFNNYTAIYHVLAEVGPRLGFLAWIAFGGLVGWFAVSCLSRRTPSWIVAGTAPAAMAIRTPWVNTFFDGTLVIWIGVALFPLLAVGLVQRLRSRKSTS
jgi:hypothetical protein